MGKKVLVVLTSADKIPKNNGTTGWYLPELAHPYKILVDAGLEVDIISPKGGVAPVDPGSVKQFAETDADSKWFQGDAKAQQLVNNTKKPSDVKASDYAAVLYPGGHGPMIDLAVDEAIAKITASVYENGGVVAAVCHGPAGLVPVKLSNGDPLVKGKEVTCFTNEEEDLVKLTDAMPFLLETRLGELGAKFKRADNWQDCVVIDGRLVTGQNPASSKNLGKAIVDLLK